MVREVHLHAEAEGTEVLDCGKGASAACRAADASGSQGGLEDGAAGSSRHGDDAFGAAGWKDEYHSGR
jgi:hypothetical protein